MIANKSGKTFCFQNTQNASDISFRRYGGLLYQTHSHKPLGLKAFPSLLRRMDWYKEYGRFGRYTILLNIGNYRYASLNDGDTL